MTYTVIRPSRIARTVTKSLSEAVQVCDLYRETDNETWRIEGVPAGRWLVHIEDGEVWTEQTH